MGGFFWDPRKNLKLQHERGMTFERIMEADLIKIKKSPRRLHQGFMIFDREGSIWVVPYVRHEDGIFLKTLYRDRKLTRRYQRGEML